MIIWTNRSLSKRASNVTKQWYHYSTSALTSYVNKPEIFKFSLQICKVVKAASTATSSSKHHLTEFDQNNNINERGKIKRELGTKYSKIRDKILSWPHGITAIVFTLRKQKFSFWGGKNLFRAFPLLYYAFWSNNRYSRSGRQLQEHFRSNWTHHQCIFFPDWSHLMFLNIAKAKKGNSALNEFFPIEMSISVTVQ